MSLLTDGKHECTHQESKDDDVHVSEVEKNVQFLTQTFWYSLFQFSPETGQLFLTRRRE